MVERILAKASLFNSLETNNPEGAAQILEIRIRHKRVQAALESSSQVRKVLPFSDRSI
jgi:hypothetical protein